MANPIFPTLTRGQDSKFYKLNQENTAMSTKMDGGYVVSRAKHTRKPRKSFTTGFSSMPNADRVKLQDFWDTVRGGSVVFDWTDPVTKTVFQVRFVGESLEYTYVGKGIAQLWDVTFKVEQA
jgi:phage-related protein